MFTDTNLLAVFTTGLLTGGLTCIAVQGGILTAALVQGEKLKNKESRTKSRDNLISVLAFIFAKLTAYTILGFILGWAGSLIQISLQARVVLQFAVVVFMLGTALNLLGVHPIFRYFMIVPPAWLARKIYKQSENKNLFAPIMLGFSTVFIPCGATQAMMALAIASASPLTGALIMFIFVLGTSPVFLILGLATLSIKSALNRQFVKLAALLLILLSLFNLDATLALANSPYTMRSFLKNGFCIVSYCSNSINLEPVAEQTITFTPAGYSPDHFAVRAGSRVTLKLVNQNVTGCIQAFTISALDIQKIVLPDKIEEISFIAPDKPGRINFTCSAGLYPGTIEVI